MQATVRESPALIAGEPLMREREAVLMQEVVRESFALMQASLRESPTFRPRPHFPALAVVSSRCESFRLRQPVRRGSGEVMERETERQRDKGTLVRVGREERRCVRVSPRERESGRVVGARGSARGPLRVRVPEKRPALAIA